tara:strand:- start:582 stop:1025 length:444 start_codon:yes stop_codon:yes gene_type:complete
MEQKFITILRKVIREELKTVIKNELTEILQEGLKSTVNEITEKPVKQKSKSLNKSKFKNSKFADILNETEQLTESRTVSDYASLMSEDIVMTSKNAQTFPMQRNIEQTAVMTDPESGKSMKVDPVIQQAMTKDYSALMKAIDRKQGK